MTLDAALTSASPFLRCVFSYRRGRRRISHLPNASANTRVDSLNVVLQRSLSGTIDWKSDPTVLNELNRLPVFFFFFFRIVSIAIVSGKNLRAKSSLFWTSVLCDVTKGPQSLSRISDKTIRQVLVDLLSF